MQQMLERAAPVWRGEHVPARPDMKAMHALVAPVDIAGKLFAVKLLVKERADGSFGLYHHEALEMETPAGNPQTASERTLGAGPATGASESISWMLTAFKGEHAKCVPKGEGNAATGKQEGNFSLPARQRRPHPAGAGRSRRRRLAAGEGLDGGQAPPRGACAAGRAAAAGRRACTSHWTATASIG